MRVLFVLCHVYVQGDNYLNIIGYLQYLEWLCKRVKATRLPPRPFGLYIKAST